MKQGRSYKLRASKTFRMINSWLFSDKYLYMHMYNEDYLGVPFQSFQIINIYKPLQPFCILDSVISV